MVLVEGRDARRGSLDSSGGRSRISQRFVLPGNGYAALPASADRYSGEASQLPSRETGTSPGRAGGVPFTSPMSMSPVRGAVWSTGHKAAPPADIRRTPTGTPPTATAGSTHFSATTDTRCVSGHPRPHAPQHNAIRLNGHPSPLARRRSSSAARDTCAPNAWRIGDSTPTCRSGFRRPS